MTALVSKQEAEHKALVASFESQQSVEDDHSKAIRTWSDSMEKELGTRHSEVEQFFTQELSRDIPTGMNVLIT